MSWQDWITLLSFFIGIPSLIVGWISMRRTGTIQEELQKKFKKIYIEKKSRDFLDLMEHLSDNIKKNKDNPNQVNQEIVNVATDLFKLCFFIESTDAPVRKIIDMAEKDYNFIAMQEKPLYTALDYSQYLAEIIAILEKEVNYNVN